MQQLEYEAQRASDQFDQVDPANRLVAEVLEQRFNEKLEEVEQVKTELKTTSDSARQLSGGEHAAIMDLGNDFPGVWYDPDCPMVLKKKIARILIEEIIVDLDDDGQQLHFIIHWRGGCHTEFEMPKPLSGALAHKTSIEDIEIITKMAIRFRDCEIARVLSKLGRKTGKGNRWTQSRVAYARKKYKIPTPDLNKLDSNILTLGQATAYTQVSDTTLMRLIRAEILPVNQVAPYAPYEISCDDLNREPVAGILERLKATGKLDLEGDMPTNQSSLFE